MGASVTPLRASHARLCPEMLPQHCPSLAFTLYLLLPSLPRVWVCTRSLFPLAGVPQAEMLGRFLPTKEREERNISIMFGIPRPPSPPPERSFDVRSLTQQRPVFLRGARSSVLGPQGKDRSARPFACPSPSRPGPADGLVLFREGGRTHRKFSVQATRSRPVAPSRGPAIKP